MINATTVNELNEMRLTTMADLPASATGSIIIRIPVF